MTTFTEGRHAAGFIISEANGSLSRDNGTVKAGEVLSAGEIIAFDGDELVAWTSGGAAGVMLYRVDASAQGTPAAFLARQAEVNAELLVYPDDVEEADALAALAERGIVARAANIGGGGDEPPEEDDDMTLLASGPLLGHTADIVLPTGYDLFTLEIFDLQGDSVTAVYYRTSSDAGVSFHEGATDYGNTSLMFARLDAEISKSGSQDDVGILIGDVADADFGATITAKIFPGSANSYFAMRIEANAMWNANGGGFPGVTLVATCLSAEKVRQDTLRLSCGGFAAAGEFISGSYILYGHTSA